MEKFTYTNSLGSSITLDYTSDYIIKEYDGLTASEIIPTTTRGYRQNGYSRINTNLGSRIISITFFVYAEDMERFYEKRRKLASVFNPLLGEGTLTYTNDYISKSINGYVSSQPTPNEKNGSLQSFRVEITCDNPFWFDNEENALKMGDFTGGLDYPLVFSGAGEKFAQKGDIANIKIVGDVPSPIRAEFKNESVNPKLTLVNTGEFIKVQTTIADEEKLIINTAYGNKTVEHIAVDGTIENAYHLITLDSSFFSLPIGENQLSFIGESGTPEVYLYWRNYYVGV